jgi:outer membrane protein OmpA-like peptidoglycan-associated protein/tetratricopeptide (TPR) repeat protein
MQFIKNGFLLLVTLLLLCAFQPSRRFVQKAEANIEKGNLALARKYYLKALEKDSLNPRANGGLGWMLSELLDNYTEALPYLERAYRFPSKDSLYDVWYALGKCYEHNGEYEKAVSFYNRLDGLKDLEKEKDLDKELKKRKEDCAYGIAHRSDPVNESLYIVNAGKTINSELPEYVPVITPKNQIIFTSKRKDSRNEKLNWLDGKYFESMYIADIEPNGFRNLRRFTLPDKFLKSRFQKNHESVVSLSQDGKKLFTYRNSDIYEADMTELDLQKPKKLLSAFSDEFYQNHAFLTKDGKFLYFTSDAEGGLGGLDIYLCTRDDNGNWGKPVNLGNKINTPYDEDAPYVTHDGNTFYFSSKGHPGFGNYDIFKSEMQNGTWSDPVNAGLPLNSPAHDIFLVDDSTHTYAYFSSGRNGGYGDMDIYKIVFLDNFNKDCQPSASMPVSLILHDQDSTDYTNTAVVSIPANYRILNSEWQLDGRFVGLGDSLKFNYKKPGNYSVYNKSMLYCDTCLTPLVACNTIQNNLREVIKPDTTHLMAGNTGTLNSDGNPALAGAEGTNSTLSGSAGSTGASVTPGAFDINSVNGLLSNENLVSIGFETKPVLFDFDKSSLRRDAVYVLRKNAEVFKKYPELEVHLIGYTDARGPASYNLRLSVRRAKSVQRYLLRRGVPASQVTLVEGKGATDFLNNCGLKKRCPEILHRQNRRVIFVVSTKN